MILQHQEPVGKKCKMCKPAVYEESDVDRAIVKFQRFLRTNTESDFLENHADAEIQTKAIRIFEEEKNSFENKVQKIKELRAQEQIKEAKKAYTDLCFDFNNLPENKKYVRHYEALMELRKALLDY